MTEKEKNPWKTIDGEEKYDNPWINVKEYRVINPAGKPGIYGKIHFKNIALGIIPLDEAYNTWLVGQYRYPLDIYSWEIPEGGGKLQAPPLTSAKRELLEETGIKAGKWQEIMTLHTSNSVSDEKGIVYVAQDLTFHHPQPDEEEELQIKKIPFEEVYRMAMENKITDAIAVAGILKTKLLIDQGKI